jgi:hypothetical protein
MASSGINRFKWFIFLCFVIGGFLLWQKYSNALEKIEIKPEVQKTISQPVIELPKPVLTPDEVCHLLRSSNDIRAGHMRDRNYMGNDIKEDNSCLYSFITNPNIGGYYGYVKFFPHQNFFEIAFHERKDYDVFRSQFHQFQKLGALGDCLERYVISNDCIACEIEFRKKADSFLMMVMRNADFAKSEVRFPPKQSPKPLRSSKDDEWEDLTPTKKVKPLLNGRKILEQGRPSEQTKKDILLGRSPKTNSKN